MKICDMIYLAVRWRKVNEYLDPVTASVLGHLTIPCPLAKKRKLLSCKSVAQSCHVMACTSETGEMMRLRPTQDVSKAKDPIWLNLNCSLPTSTLV